MPTHQPLPEQFGRYRIERQLGAGGMGAVYLALDTRLGRRVALKVPHFTAADGMVVIERFQREARVAALLDHPNLCPVHDVDEVGGVHFFTMPFIEGTPLSQLIDHPWAPPQAAEMLRQVALALALLHRHGIVHRDLKPANVMVRPTGEPVLMDFGLARSYAAVSKRLTAEGTALGTPAYMSPEQVEGDPKKIGPATDIYSLGVILYELLTGQVPFEGPMLAVFAQVLNAEPRAPAELRPELDAAIDAICTKAMAKKPEGRYRDMSAVAAALVEYARRSEPTPAPWTGAADRPGADEAITLPTGPAQPAPPRPGSDTSAPGFLETAGAPEVLPRPARGRVAAPPDRSPGPRGGLGLLGAGVLAGALLTISATTWLMLHNGEDGDSGRSGQAARDNPHAPDKGRPPVQPAGLEKETTNKLGLKLVLIRKGSFRMGSPPGEAGRNDDEDPQHDVEITRDFYMAATEVTVGQFRAFVQENNYKTDAEKAGSARTWQENGYSSSDDQPVVYVSWNDAVAFCQWLSKKEGRTCELPTEAEWEWACRAGTTTPYSFDDPKRLGEHAWCEENSRTTTQPVGKKKPNACGLYDMHGNVFEWCKDGPRQYKKEFIQDPKGPENGEERVLRGGSFGASPDVCRSAERAYNGPLLYRDFNVGFRIVLRVPP